MPHNDYPERRQGTLAPARDIAGNIRKAAGILVAGIGQMMAAEIGNVLGVSNGSIYNACKQMEITRIPTFGTWRDTFLKLVGGLDCEAGFTRRLEAIKTVVTGVTGELPRQVVPFHAIKMLVRKFVPFCANSVIKLAIWQLTGAEKIFEARVSEHLFYSASSETLLTFSYNHRAARRAPRLSSADYAELASYHHSIVPIIAAAGAAMHKGGIDLNGLT